MPRKPIIISDEPEINITKMEERAKEVRRGKVRTFLGALLAARRAKRYRELSEDEKDTMEFKKAVFKEKPIWYSKITEEVYERQGNDKIGKFLGYLERAGRENIIVSAEERQKREKEKEEKEKRGLEKGKEVLQMKEIQSQIGKYASQVYDLTGDRDRAADAARKLQDARVKAMKNKELEKLTKRLIEINSLACLFDDAACYKLNYGHRDGVEGYNFYGEISLVPGADVAFDDEEMWGSVVFSDRDASFPDEHGDYIDLDEALSVFENFGLGFYNTVQSVSSVEEIPDLSYSLDTYMDYLEEKFRDEHGKRKKFKKPSVVWSQVFGYSADNSLSGDDRKFYLVYLKKKFNISESDIKDMVEKGKAALAPYYAAQEKLKEDMKKKKEEEKEKFKQLIARMQMSKEEKKQERKQKTSEAGIPQGKNNAKVFTKAEYLAALKASGFNVEKADKGIPEGAKVKAYLARTKIHRTILKE